MKKQSACKSFAAAALFATGCTSNHSTGSVATPLPSFSHSREITNPYLPLASLKQDVLQNKDERVEHTAKSDAQMFQVDGQPIETFAVEDHEFDSSGNLTRATLDYFAQDNGGNVYYVGEDVDEYKAGKTLRPWRCLAVWQGYVKVRSADARSRVAFGNHDRGRRNFFSHCVKIKERDSDDDTEYKLYSMNVGCIKEVEGKNPLSLQSHQIHKLKLE